MVQLRMITVNERSEWVGLAFGQIHQNMLRPRVFGTRRMCATWSLLIISSLASVDMLTDSCGDDDGSADDDQRMSRQLAKAERQSDEKWWSRSDRFKGL